VLADPDALREQVRGKYREVAVDPGASFHFRAGRSLAARLGYEAAPSGALPDGAVESFAGVGNPFSLRRLAPGEKVADAGSGAGFDSFIAAGQVGPGGHVAGVDMTPRCWPSHARRPKRSASRTSGSAAGSPSRYLSPTAGPAW
jgi:arsenite methyltransferase